MSITTASPTTSRSTPTTSRSTSPSPAPSTPPSPTTSRLLGYARVSTNGQELKLQLDALAQAGCPKAQVFTDKVSGAKSARPGLDRCLQQLKQGDVLVVWRLDRLGRSMRHLLDLVDQLRQRGVGFKSLCDGVIDTTTASGELVFHIFTALAQFEQRLIQERTRAAFESARARGRLGGRKAIPANDPRVKMVKKMHADKSIPVPDIRPCGFRGRLSIDTWRENKPTPHRDRSR